MSLRHSSGGGPGEPVSVLSSSDSVIHGCFGNDLATTFAEVGSLRRAGMRAGPQSRPN
jgi:hypothetical protein